jgi:hypothetical protein
MSVVSCGHSDGISATVLLDATTLAEQMIA